MINLLLLTAAIEEVVITGNRNGEPLAELAASVSVLQGEALNAGATTRIDQILNQAAGVNLQNTNGQQHLTAIRSPVLTSGAGQGSFLYLEDGLALRAAAFGNVNAMLESSWELADGIEVWRGPGSAAYGSNAIHGVINVRNEQPSGQQFSVSYSDSSSSIRARMSSESGFLKAYGLNDEGWRDSTGAHQAKALIGGTLNSDNYEMEASLAAHSLDQQTAGFIFGADAYKDDNLIYTNPNPDAYREVDGFRVRSQLTLGNSGFSVTPYYREVESELLMHFLPSQAIENAKQQSVGFMSNYRAEAGSTTFHSGIDIDATRGSLREEQLIPDVFSYTQGMHYDYQVDTTTLGYFFQLSATHKERLDWLIGMRYEASRYDYENFMTSGVDGRFYRPEDSADKFELFMPKLRVNYRLNTEQNLWFRVARGARAPQASDLYRLQINQTGGSAGKEVIDSVEFGWRYNLADLSLAATTFAMRKRGVFFRDANGFSEANGETEHLGLELEGNWQFTEGLLWTGSMSYANHTYAFTRAISGGPNTTESIVSGNQVDTAPEWLASQRLSWRINDALSTAMQWQLVGAYYMDASNQHEYDGHQLWSASADYQIHADIQVSLGVENLLDTRYANRADYAFGNERYLPGRPRTASVGIDWRW
ncbi:TonB-dependent receptor [Umboniibacter marinipuniceus]|uniref:Outer membrane receptor protein involved in Fe transport n=1 Tax=Umboniibacter marinipuniceus TaxID=569599 RepID=A0A3M0AC99_9GAMM|nr:TonB-dependent receptor [Umboniibacter marinipuniceus]RMA82550.1 outer membrane receptor protein involved in Fe transport [Umboniibacter marinipuniceus]